MTYYIAVDVGSGSVRAAVVSENGTMVATACKEIQIYQPQPDLYEQSSDDIWEAVVYSIKEAISTAGVSKHAIGGVGFDATCSLVVLDQENKPLSISPSGAPECNVIMWMDHRATKQTEKINATGHDVLKYVGGAMSLEMEPPKLLWLKENLKEQCWDKAGHFFELPDFLTWKATGSLTRSLCSVVCKWGFQADDNGKQEWSESFLKSIGLGDLIENNYYKIGSEVRAPGEWCGGLLPSTARELGLNPAITVAQSILDAHAGGLGCLACNPEDPDFPISSSSYMCRMAIIAGTSTCHMVASPDPIFVNGVWGPYYSAMIPHMWLNEGGQSSSGKLIDFIIESHPAYKEAEEKSKERDVHMHTFLNELLDDMAETEGKHSIAELTTDYHMWPDYHGNRSPVADWTLKGMLSGLTLSSSIENLALKYLATIQSLAYGTRHIVDEMNTSGHDVCYLSVCGGLSKNNLFVQTNADITNLPMILPHNTESVLLGSAILAASASGNYTNIQDAMEKMGGLGTVILPDMDLKQYHEKKYKVFLKMLADQREYRNIMSS
ncbi:hypothetical protein SNE40_004586 [Patella caerulea]|uniref:FGGY carbohydrate kinase domain-containing protein n=1 Tax=Patella caerulea TaxID=87958 RepID=A0AAN8PXD2_PATCE